MKVILNNDECRLVLEGLGELPLKIARPVYNYIELMYSAEAQGETHIDMELEDFDIVTAGLGELQAKKVYPLLLKLHGHIGAYENGQRHKEQANGNQSEVGQEFSQGSGQEDEEGGNNR